MTKTIERLADDFLFLRAAAPPLRRLRRLLGGCAASMCMFFLERQTSALFYF